MLWVPGLAMGEEPAVSNGPSHKVGVVSFAALSGEVPLRAGGQAAAMLTNERAGGGVQARGRGGPVS
jgi:hypothetical protein